MEGILGVWNWDNGKKSIRALLASYLLMDLGNTTLLYD